MSPRATAQASLAVVKAAMAAVGAMAAVANMVYAVLVPLTPMALAMPVNAQAQTKAQAQAQAVTQAEASPRPQLSPAQAATHTESAYLGDWQPLSTEDIARLASARPDLRVAPGESLQQAIDRVPDAEPDADAGAGAAAKRWLIHVAPGEYRGPLCIRHKAPLVVIGLGDDPAAVRLVDGRYNALAKPAGQAVHPCLPDSRDSATYGTAGSASAIVDSDDLVMARLSIVNDAMDGVRAGQGYPVGAGEAGGAQAVALTLAGDRLLLHEVRLLGHQDTLYARRGPQASPSPKHSPSTPARQLIRHSLIAGDVDYVFGDATLVISHSTLLSRAGRRTPGAGGITLAPSSAPQQTQGFLVVHSRWRAEPGVAPGSVALGRAWDAGVKPGTWRAGHSPNGLAVVRECDLGEHLKPWTSSTSRRPFEVEGDAANRLFEFANTGPGALP